VDWWRSLKPNCLGSIYWQLNDIWPCPSWSSLEYSGKRKLFMYAAKKFYEDIYLCLFVKDNKIHAVIYNDTNRHLLFELTIKFIKFDGTEYKNDEI